VTSYQEETLKQDETLEQNETLEQQGKDESEFHKKKKKSLNTLNKFPQGVVGDCMKVIMEETDCSFGVARNIVYNYSKIGLNKFVKKAIDELCEYKDILSCCWKGTSRRTPLPENITVVIETVALKLFDCNISDVITAGNAKCTDTRYSFLKKEEYQ